MEIDKDIIRAYDIRGVYGKTLTEEIMKSIGIAIGTMMIRQNLGNELLIGNDIRSSSPSLSRAFIEGARSAGINVTNVGTSSFGEAIFSGWKLKKDITAYITASHNPSGWNGIKFFDKNCIGFFEKDNKEIGRIAIENDFEPILSEQYRGSLREIYISDEYIDYLKGKFEFKKKMKVVVDCGNGSTSMIMKKLFDSINGIDADIISYNIDPTFPDRGADIEKENLEQLRKRVILKGADIGIAFDGDGDRVGMVDDKGDIIIPERIMVLIGKDMLTKTPGNVIANVACSMVLEKTMEPLGGKVIRIPVGHTFLMQAAREHNAVLGGEPSYHFSIPSYLPFDDAIVASLKMIEVLSKTDRKLSELLDEIPSFPRNRTYVDCPDSIKFKVIDNLRSKFSHKYKKINTMDGVRIDFENSWVLIRASNTTPLIRMTVEAVNKDELKKIEREFLEELKAEIERVKTVSVSQ